MTEKEILESILYRDGLILIINKPSGIPVHAGSYADAPEIDGYVFIDDGQELTAGDIVKVKIEDFSEHDLFGTLVE